MSRKREHVESLGLDAFGLQSAPDSHDRLIGTLGFGIPGRGYNYLVPKNTRSNQLALGHVGVTPITGSPAFVAHATCCDDVSISVLLELRSSCAHTIATNPAFHY